MPLQHDRWPSSMLHGCRMRHHPTAAAAAEELAAGATYGGLHRAVRRQPLKSWTHLEADAAAAAAAEVAVVVVVAVAVAPPRRMHQTYEVKGGAQSRQRRRLMTPLTRFGMMMMMVMTTKMTLMSLRVLWRQRRRFVDDFHQLLSHATPRADTCMNQCAWCACVCVCVSSSSLAQVGDDRSVAESIQEGDRGGGRAAHGHKARVSKLQFRLAGAEDGGYNKRGRAQKRRTSRKSTKSTRGGGAAGGKRAGKSRRRSSSSQPTTSTL